MNRLKNTGLVLCGLALGLSLSAPAAQAVESLKATLSTNRVLVDGQEVRLTAYNINGSNYVRLRDIGKAVGFEVYWDSENGCVQVESGKPYTGEAPAKAEPDKPLSRPEDTSTTIDVNALKQDIIDRTNALRKENGVAALRILKGFGMRLLAFDPYPSAAALDRYSYPRSVDLMPILLSSPAARRQAGSSRVQSASPRTFLSICVSASVSSCADAVITEPSSASTASARRNSSCSFSRVNPASSARMSPSFFSGNKSRSAVPGSSSSRLHASRNAPMGIFRISYPRTVRLLGRERVALFLLAMWIVSFFQNGYEKTPQDHPWRVIE